MEEEETRVRKPYQDRPPLAVHVTFEASRLAVGYLADAYEQIVPQVRRTTGARRPADLAPGAAALPRYEQVGA